VAVIVVGSTLINIGAGVAIAGVTGVATACVAANGVGASGVVVASICARSALIRIPLPTFVALTNPVVTVTQVCIENGAIRCFQTLNTTAKPSVTATATGRNVSAKSNKRKVTTIKTAVKTTIKTAVYNTIRAAINGAIAAPPYGTFL
tara:strand:- start:505 stop:948 length:444 start_codon:yes stop_codon:yes gene_type:complete